MSSNSSFLPDDYLDQKAERRTNLISLALFAVVMLGVFLAFLFTNQKWTDVKRDQEVINARYQKAAAQIKELVELEKQKEEMLHKAELAAALVERVPRSVLLAELVNRMPPELSLLSFELKSEKVKAVPTKDAKKPAGNANRMRPQRAQTRKEASGERTRVRPPKYKVQISLVGVAPTGNEVSEYMTELNTLPLLRDVIMEYVEEKDVEGQKMQEFEIKMRLDPKADVRNVEPRIAPRESTVDDPMSDRLRFDLKEVQQGTTAVTLPEGREGD
jgi:Tfp pilus assembly protein PilN